MKMQKSRSNLYVYGCRERDWQMREMRNKFGILGKSKSSGSNEEDF